jgi:uncharacterized protein YukE
MWMDTTQARGHAAKINSSVELLGGLIEKVTKMIEGIYWEGEDKKRFVDDWQSQLQPRHAEVSDALRQGAHELVRRADAQDTLSQTGHC